LKMWSPTYTSALFVVISNFCFIFLTMWSFSPLFFSLHYKDFLPLQLINQWLNVLNDYQINCNHRILLQILSRKSYSHILMVIWLIYDNMVIRDDIIFSLQVFIHMASMTKWHGCLKYHLKMGLG
jgi:hypothetical protein